MPFTSLPTSFAIDHLEPRRLLAAATFTYDPPAGTPNPHSLRFDIDQGQLPAQTLLALTNLTTGESISPVTMTTGTWGGGASAIFTFPTYTNGVVNGVLPNGNYYAVLVDRAQQAGQQVLLGTEFFVFAPDPNHDRQANLSDFNIVAGNFGGTNKRFSEGDLNYDGTVNLADFNLIAGAFGNGLPESTVPIKLTGIAVSTEGIDKWWTPLSGATQYRLEMSLDGIEFFDFVELDTSSTTAWSVDLAPNQTTYFRVVGANSSGDLGTSNVVRAKTFPQASAAGNPIVRFPDSPALMGPPPDGTQRLLVAFNGLYLNNPLESDGNRWFEQIVREDGNSIKPGTATQRSYNHHTQEVEAALADLLPRIDTDGNQIITIAEGSASRVAIMSYSWGCIPAGKLSRRLRDDNILVGGSILYHMEQGVDIPVKLLLTLDPVHSGPARLVRWINGKIETNVQKFVNWYQRRGGTSTFGLWLAPTGTNSGFNPIFQVDTYTFGTGASGLLRGTTLPHNLAPANVAQVNLNTLGNRFATNYLFYEDPLNPTDLFEANLRANGVEHLGLPWYVRGGTGGSFSNDFNALWELSNV